MATALTALTFDSNRWCNQALIYSGTKCWTPKTTNTLNRFPEANAPGRVAIRDLYHSEFGRIFILLQVMIPDNQALGRFGFREAVGEYRGPITFPDTQQQHLLFSPPPPDA
jgi:hypothetical protein